MGLMCGTIVENTKGTGLRINFMGKVSTAGEKAESMKASTNTIISMDLAATLGQMAGSILENGGIISDMGKAN